MMKKILLTFILLFGLISVTFSQSITMTTTSSSGTWSPQSVTNSGANLVWTATGPIVGSPVVINANNPTFDFSSNTTNGNIIITITSADNLINLTGLEFCGSPVCAGNGNASGNITSANFTEATSLTFLSLRYNELSTIDVSTLINLTELNVRGNNQSIGSLDISNNTLLTTLWVDETDLITLDISNNPALNYLRVDKAQFTSQSLDDLIIQLDQHGLFNGYIKYDGSSNDNLSYNSLNAYNSLLARGWTLVGDAPPAQNTQTITLTTTSVSSNWSPQTVVNSGATLTWEAIGNSISEVINADDPTFDFSANDGSPINVTITSNQGFIGLTILDFCGGVTCEGGDITNIDVSNATDLITLNTRYNELNSLDVSSNTALTELVVRGHNQLSSGIDISSLTSLTTFWADVTALNNIDVSNNNLLTSVWLHDANLTTAQLDQLLMDLDANGASDGELRILNNPEELSTAASTAYDNLIGRNWTIDADPPGVPINQEIEVSINGSIILNNESYDMGDVIIGDSEDITVTISNKGSLPLQIYTHTLDNITGPGDFSQTFINNFIIQAGSSEDYTVTFDNTNNSTEGLANARINILNNDVDEGGFPPSQQGYFIGLTANSIALTTNEAIEVTGNGNLIVNGSSTPEISNDTDFGQVLINVTETKTYSITNTGTDDLEITDIIYSGDSEFSGVFPTFPQTITAGASLDFDMEFNSSVVGSFGGEIIILNSDMDENPYRFDIAATAVTNVTSGDIMISQYYSGFSGNDNWIEIMNISDQTIPANTYYVNLYLRDKAQVGIIESAIPDDNYLIVQSLAPGDILLIRNSLAALPLPENIGPAEQEVEHSICDFSPNGDHVLLISPSNTSDAYTKREDIIGNIGDGGFPNPWGNDVSYVKGGCASETPHLEFDISDWINVPIEEVDDANSNRNVALGTQWIGITEFDGLGWSNGVSDRTRNARITNSIGSASQSIEACSIEIPAGINVNFDSDGSGAYSLVVYGDLIVDGNLTIGDTESLVTYDNNASLDVITKIEKSNNLTDIHQSTYWSAPVQGAQLSTIFSGVNPNRIFELRPGAVNPAYVGTNYEHWFVANGTMANAKGYAAEGASTGIQTLNFTGIPNNGNIYVNVYYKGSNDLGEENDNFNLIGNPYPTAINIDELFTLNNNSLSEIALWVQGNYDNNGEFNSNDYVYYNNGGSSDPPNSVTNNIGSGQGFMARTLSYAQLVFSNSMKMVDRNNQFFKTNTGKNATQIGTDKNRMWLELDLNSSKSNAMVGFFDEATDEIDLGYDTYGFNQGKEVNLYSLIANSNSKFIIQGLGSFNENKSVDIGYSTKKTGKLSLKLVGTEGLLNDREIYLIDHYLGIMHDLSKGNYEFDVDESGTFNDRFTVQFISKALNVEEIVTKDDFIVSNEINGLKINAKQTVETIKVYDMLGRLIVDNKPELKTFSLPITNIKPGTVLLINATLEGGEKVNRKTIKY